MLTVILLFFVCMLFIDQMSIFVKVTLNEMAYYRSVQFLFFTILNCSINFFVTFNVDKILPETKSDGISKPTPGWMHNTVVLGQNKIYNTQAWHQ